MTDKNNSIYAPYFEKNDEPFFMKRQYNLRSQHTF